MFAAADPLLLGIAVAFALVNGANDGGTLLALGLQVTGLRVLAAVVVLSALLALVPLLVGTGVATTLATRLVTFEGDLGRQATAVAVVAAVVVTAGLARAGLPTSLTLALIGGLAGAGLGAGLPVSWPVVAGVLAAAAAAPVLGGVLAYGLSRVALRVRLPGRASVTLARAHMVGWSLQGLAYGANDGQKMLAVAAVAADATLRPVPADPGLLAALAVLFLCGALLGVWRLARTVGGMIPVRAPNAVIGETAASVAVLGSAAVGAPVSMTQAVAGGLVGTGVSEGYRRVRWKVALQIAVAWVVTLPAALALAAAVASGLALLA